MDSLIKRFIKFFSGIDVDELCNEVELRKDSNEIPTVTTF